MQQMGVWYVEFLPLPLFQSHPVPYLTGFKISKNDALRWMMEMFYSSHIPDNDPWVGVGQGAIWESNISKVWFSNSPAINIPACLNSDILIVRQSTVLCCGSFRVRVRHCQTLAMSVLPHCIKLFWSDYWDTRLFLLGYWHVRLLTCQTTGT